MDIATAATPNQVHFIYSNLLIYHKDELIETFSDHYFEDGSSSRTNNLITWCRENLSRMDASRIIGLVKNGQRKDAWEDIKYLGIPIK